MMPDRANALHTLCDVCKSVSFCFLSRLFPAEKMKILGRKDHPVTPN